MLDLTYGYGAGTGQMGSGSTPGNSGQLVSVSGTINNQNRNQAFTYDNVGRLVTATGLSTQGSTQVAWARRYEYDRHGNRTAEWNAVSGAQLQNMALQQVGGITTNRIQMDSVSGTAFGYDVNGNLTDDGVREYTYDAANRIVGVRVKLSGLSESYGYDAGNRRVKKVVGGVVTHYIWEGTQVIAEYERGGGSTQATGIRYYHQDRLSTRVITDGVGAVKGTTDQLPFGEEIGISGEGEKHKFDGSYERDSTGLDYAVNRHYDPRQGRFNQVDPLGMGATSLADPQSLNRYSYVGNDPVNKIDPTGLLKRIPTLQEYGEQRTADFLDFYLRSLEFHGSGSGGSGGVRRDSGRGGGGSGGGEPEPEPEPQQRETDCSRFVDFIVDNVEWDRDFSAPASLIFSTATVVGHGLLLMAREHSHRLGNADHTFVGFRPELTDIQADGVYQHVAAHAGATVIGHNKLLKTVQDNSVGGRKATTGYELTDFALQEDERQFRTATDPMRRRENTSEINDDHAGRLIGGDINRRINGEITRDQLRSSIFDRLCQ